MEPPLDLSSMVFWLVFASIVGAALLAFAAAVKGDRITRRLFLRWANQGGYRTLREELTSVGSMFICLAVFSAWMVFDNWWALLVPVGYVGGACMRAWTRNNLRTAEPAAESVSGPEVRNVVGPSAPGSGVGTS